MFSIESSILISAPRDDVFAILTDVERFSEIISTITRSERLDGGPLGVGSRVRITRRIQNRRITYETQVVEFVPNESIATEIKAHGAHQTTFLVLADEQGETRVDLCLDIRPHSVLTKLLWRLFSRPIIAQSRTLMEKELAEFKIAAECGVEQ